jgi:hypothetical protein
MRTEVLQQVTTRHPTFTHRASECSVYPSCPHGHALVVRILKCTQACQGYTQDEAKSACQAGMRLPLLCHSTVTRTFPSNPWDLSPRWPLSPCLLPAMARPLAQPSHAARTELPEHSHHTLMEERPCWAADSPCSGHHHLVQSRGFHLRRFSLSQKFLSSTIWASSMPLVKID